MNIDTLLLSLMLCFHLFAKLILGAYAYDNLEICALTAQVWCNCQVFNCMVVFFLET